ncbi:MAG: DUF2203 domain-containing protein [Anaerolineales bacterium]|nr:DUF2203 domain-containing protein [Anaerolineales bacterium]
MTRYFTVEEANIMLEVIRPLMREILDIRQVIFQKQPELVPVLNRLMDNGGSLVASQVALEIEQLHILIGQVLVTGVSLKDINSGLVDFLSRRDERDVYLCWRYGEESVSYWHDLETGFAGRQPI